MPSQGEDVPYDEKLVELIRGVLPLREDLTEQKMFGGIAFLMDGKMFIGAMRDDLIVRVGPDRHKEALGLPHVREFDFSGRPSRGFVYVGRAGIPDPEAIRGWVEWSMAFVSSLPAKQKKTRPRPRGPRA